MEVTPEPYIDDDGNLVASEWVGHGNPVLVKRSALNFDHPESYPSLWYRFFKEPIPDSVAIKLWGEAPDIHTRIKLDKIGKGGHITRCPHCGGEL